MRPPRRRFSALDMELTLDLAERVGVLILFLLIVNRLLPRLVQLVLFEREHPELILAAAGISAQLLLLVTGEALGVLLILIRRRSSSLSTQPFNWALSFSAVSAPLLLTTSAPASAFIPGSVTTTVMLMGLLIQICGKLSAQLRAGTGQSRRADARPLPLRAAPDLCRLHADPYRLAS